MKSNKNSNSQARTTLRRSSQIRHTPRGDAFKNAVDHFDVAKVRNVSEALEAFNTTSFQSRLLGRCFKIWLRMLSDPDRPLIFFGLSGAMIAGGMRRILRNMRIDRVYDTYADDVKFTETDEFVENFADSLEPRSYSSRELFQLMGEQVKDEHGILATAAREKLPVFCPALADSSIGMAL